MVPVYNFIQRLQNMYIYMLIGTKFVIVMRLYIMPAHERQALNFVISRARPLFARAHSMGLITEQMGKGHQMSKAKQWFFERSIEASERVSEAMALVALDEYKPWHVLQKGKGKKICSHVFQTLVIILGARQNDVNARVVLPGTCHFASHMHLKSWHLLHPIAKVRFCLQISSYPAI